MEFKIAKEMQTALNAYALREKAITNNLANSDTPNYKREFVRFEEYLNDYNTKFKLKGVRTNVRHFEIPPNRRRGIAIEKDNSVSHREDGNNVNVDVEQAEMSKNLFNFKTVSQNMSGYYKSLLTGITGGRK